jgi:predicted regulator of amino acid metabolism with ACT domain
VYVFAHEFFVWPNVKKQFSRQAVRPDIVRKMIQCGMRVSDDDKIYVDNVEVDYSAVARAVDVDRRVVKQTVKQIRKNRYLNSIFSRTKPLGTSLVDLVSLLGYSALIIEADPKSPGVMAGVAEILARHGMVVRQALADDPDMVPDAKMTLVVEGQLAGNALEELNGLKLVRSIKILK